MGEEVRREKLTPMLAKAFQIVYEGDDPPTYLDELGANQLAALAVQLKKLRKDSQAIDSELVGAQEAIIPYIHLAFASEKMTRVTILNQTVTPTEEIYGSPDKSDLVEQEKQARGDEDIPTKRMTEIEKAARARLVEALKDDPTTAALVVERVDANTLTAWVKESAEDEASEIKFDEALEEWELPEHLRGKLRISKKQKISIRKA